MLSLAFVRGGEGPGPRIDFLKLNDVWKCVFENGVPLGISSAL
jgi:hypothetical protein